MREGMGREMNGMEKKAVIPPSPSPHFFSLVTRPAHTHSLRARWLEGGGGRRRRGRWLAARV